MRNPFQRASAHLASIGHSILRPDQAGSLSRGDFEAYGHGGRGIDQAERDRLVGLATIERNQTRFPLAFAVFGGLRPAIRLNGAIRQRPDLRLKLAWGAPLSVEDLLVEEASSWRLNFSADLEPGLYELTIDRSVVPFLLYDPESPSVPLQVEPDPDIATHVAGVTRSPNLIGVVFRSGATDEGISALAQSLPAIPVSYSQYFRLVMFKLAGVQPNSFEVLSRLRNATEVEHTFVPGERRRVDPERGESISPVTIRRPDFQVPGDEPGAPLLLA